MVQWIDRFKMLSLVSDVVVFETRSAISSSCSRASVICVSRVISEKRLLRAFPAAIKTLLVAGLVNILSGDR